MPTFIESIRVFQQQFAQLEVHQERVNQTFKNYFPDVPPIALALLKIPENIGQGLFKCRMVYDTVIQEISFQPYQVANIQRLKIIEAPEMQYNFKFAERTALQAAYMQKGEADDVLITQQGFLKDTSYGNIALWNGKQWLTPKVPLLEGTQRKRLIQAKIIFPAPIHTSELVNFTHFKVFNAMRVWEEVPATSYTSSDFKI